MRPISQYPTNSATSSRTSSATERVAGSAQNSTTVDQAAYAESAAMIRTVLPPDGSVP